jgi:hypothetical protein
VSRRAVSSKARESRLLKEAAMQDHTIEAVVYVGPDGRGRFVNQAIRDCDGRLLHLLDGYFQK